MHDGALWFTATRKESLGISLHKSSGYHENRKMLINNVCQLEGTCSKKAHLNVFEEPSN